MKNSVKIKKWQLTRWRANAEVADLTDAEFVAVGKGAFQHRNKLEAVRLPVGVTAIKTDAFRACKRLKRVILSGEENIGLSGGVFRNCTRLQGIEHSEMVSVIGARAFDRCIMLKDMTLGSDLRRIGERAFSGCRSLEALTLPASLQGIGKRAFEHCTELVSVQMDDSVKCMAPEQFRGCISLTDLHFSACLEQIPKGAFRGCSAMTAVTVPSQITKIGTKAFYGCARLEQVTLELGVTQIGAKAFAATRDLKAVTVPHTLKRLGFGAFGLGRRKEKTVLYVANEYMLRRMKRLVLLCGSAGCVEVVMNGQTIEERKRARRRAQVEQTPTHLIDRFLWGNT